MAKTIRFTVPPMDLVLSLHTKDSATEQIYNATTGEFSPNRKLIPVVVVPEISIVDPAGVIPSSTKGNTLLTSNTKWFCNGVQVGTTYDMQMNNTVGDENRGTLTVRRNCDNAEPLVFSFEGEIYHSPTKRRGFVSGSITLGCAIDSAIVLSQDSHYTNGMVINPMLGTSTKYGFHCTLREESTPIHFMSYIYEEGGTASQPTYTLKTKGYNISDFVFSKSEFLSGGVHKRKYVVYQTDCRKEVLSFLKSKNKSSVSALTSAELEALKASLNTSLPKQEKSSRTLFKNFTFKAVYPEYTATVECPQINQSGDIEVVRVGANVKMKLSVTMSGYGTLSSEKLNELFEVRWFENEPYMQGGETKSLTVSSEMTYEPVVREKLTGNTRYLDY